MRSAIDINIFAMPHEAEAASDDARMVAVVLDGVEKSDFLQAPATFADAARQQWDPVTWVIALDPGKAQKWPEIDPAAPAWVEIIFSIGQPGADDGEVNFPDAENPGRRTALSIKQVRKVADGAILSKLNGYARLSGADAASEAEIRDVLESATARCEERMLLVLDVGQGNWNALADASGCPDRPPVIRLFYDCGVAIGMHRRTMPSPHIDPLIGLDRDVPVVLSHWDMDHWAGAALGQPLFGSSSKKADRGIKINWRDEALDRKWIVPVQGLGATGQRITSTAWRLALALRRRGNLMIWPAGLGHLELGSGDWILRCTPVGASDNNNTGLALVLKTPLRDGADAYTLAIGDAQYSSLPAACLPLSHPGALTGLVASHHGGVLTSDPPVPNGRWSKLAYSHGARHGHPMPASKLAHKTKGWRHAYETHERRLTILSDGARRKVGTVALGGIDVSRTSALGSCADCAARCAICPAY